MKRIPIIAMLALSSWSMTATAMLTQSIDNPIPSEVEIDKLKRCHTQNNIAVQVLSARIYGVSKQEQIESFEEMSDELLEHLINNLPKATNSSDNMSLDERLLTIIDEAYELPNISIIYDGNISDEQFQELEDFGSKSLESCLMRLM